MSGTRKAYQLHLQQPVYILYGMILEQYANGSFSVSSHEVRPQGPDEANPPRTHHGGALGSRKGHNTVPPPHCSAQLCNIYAQAISCRPPARSYSPIARRTFISRFASELARDSQLAVWLNGRASDYDWIIRRLQVRPLSRSIFCPPGVLLLLCFKVFHCLWPVGDLAVYIA